MQFKSQTQQNVEDFVKALSATKMGAYLRWLSVNFHSGIHREYGIADIPIEFSCIFAAVKL